jgi:hypothetical protein
MVIKTTVGINGKIEINFYFEENLEKTYCFKSSAS